MTVEQAHQNLASVLNLGRITMPAGPLTCQEHIVLRDSLGLLFDAAKEKEELKKEGEKNVGTDK